MKIIAEKRQIIEGSGFYTVSIIDISTPSIIMESNSISKEVADEICNLINGNKKQKEFNAISYWNQKPFTIE